MMKMDTYEDTFTSRGERFLCVVQALFYRAAKRIATRSKSSLYYIVFGCLSLLPISSVCQENLGNILILLSDNDDVYLDVATTITNSTIKFCRNRELACQNSNFDIVQISSYTAQQHKNYRLIITLGIQAALFTQQQITDATIISALIPKRNDSIETSSEKNPQHHYLYLDQPPERSLLLIKTLSARFKNIGTLISDRDKALAATLRTSAERLGLTLYIEPIASTGYIGTSLNNLLDEIDIFLAIPDTDIHNKSTVSNILLSTYRKRIPLIGFSSAYVKAGALAAVYSSPVDIAHQVRDKIVDHFLDKPIPKRQQMDNYFSVLFNTDVARSLGFPIKSETKLKEKMMDHTRYDSE